ncbi:MAG TPA: SBBP repeat-containing protein, partial [Ignavibacteriaceae bacterium]|nr:SBBP repeat-containing protein [Ignavibacteriaceae bacterium]
MKKIIFILIIISSSLWAQVPDTMWITNYSGPDSLDNQPVKLLVDQSNNIIITGVQSTISGRGDIFIIKYDQDRTLLWSDIYDGPAHKTDEPTHLAIDAYGYIYVTGESRGIIGLSECSGTVILKYHPTGELAWAKRYDEQIG